MEAVAMVSSENQMVASVVARVGTVDGLDGCSVEIPISNRKRNWLVMENRRVISKPCVLPLRLAVSKARIYKQPVLTRHRELSDHIQHLIPESLEKVKL